MSTTAPEGTGTLAERRLPPVVEIAVAVMILVVAAGIYMAAHFPAPPPVGLPLALLVLAAALNLVNVALLSRIRDFSWSTFFLVGRWALLAYLIIAGMLEYVFLLDHIQGTGLVLMTLILAIFAIDVPTIVAFSVARYQPAGGTGASS